MPVNLRNRSLLELADLARGDPLPSRSLPQAQAEKARGHRQRRLAGKNICLIFEKTSTRTRCAFEVAAYDLGMGVTYLDPSGSQIGHKESIKDTARVLGPHVRRDRVPGVRAVDREELARFAGVPVYNGLTDESHPTQMLADFMTMEEHAGQAARRRSPTATWATRATTWATRSCSWGRAWGWTSASPRPGALAGGRRRGQRAHALARESGARMTLTDDPKRGVEGCDFVYTDVWVSLGEPPAKWAERIELLKPYQVDAALMAATGNPTAKFMHCLPAFHDRGRPRARSSSRSYGMDGLEVTEEVFESQASIVFDQAENRMHTIKAILLATLG